MQPSTSLEHAAQELVTELHTQFDESVVLARVFVTVPFGELPPCNKDFVRRLAESAGSASQLKDDTPVFSLIRSHGQVADWNDRRRSKGHVGIPLISSAFVDAVPMISGLLKELGVPIEWVDSHDSQVIVQTIGSAAGLFFRGECRGSHRSQGTQDHRGTGFRLRPQGQERVWDGRSVPGWSDDYHRPVLSRFVRPSGSRTFPRFDQFVQRQDELPHRVQKAFRCVSHPGSSQGQKHDEDHQVDEVRGKAELARDTGEKEQ